ncbi:MAG: pirin family protein [Bacteroidota bacterium]
MSKIRTIDKIIKGKLSSDGAGVKLRRIFGFTEQGQFDPFLLLDFFGSDNPDDFIAGFPWHPHRGIETVTYMQEGKVEHGDSLGNKGVLGAGDIQWMTAGSGIIHQEMPKSAGKGMHGFQLWVNLPASHKMIPPRYQDINSKEVPEIIMPSGIKVKVLAGMFMGKTGPVKDIIADPVYLDIGLPPETEFSIEVKPEYTAFVLVYDGEANFDDSGKVVGRLETALLENGSVVKAVTKNQNVKFLFISGKPLKEPIAWGGPIVMNTEEEIQTAFREYRDGSFVK